MVHFARHLEEIALAALPAEIESDAESDTNASSESQASDFTVQALRSEAQGGFIDGDSEVHVNELHAQAQNVGLKDADTNNDEDEPRYCFCNGVSYGQMVACDNDACPREWFHLDCVSLDKVPVGQTKWFCSDQCQEQHIKDRAKLKQSPSLASNREEDSVLEQLPRSDPTLSAINDDRTSAHQERYQVDHTTKFAEKLGNDDKQFLQDSGASVLKTSSNLIDDFEQDLESNKCLEEDHPEVLITTENLAFRLSKQGKHAEVEELYRRALSLRERELGERHPDTMLALGHVALSLQRQGNCVEAEGMFRRLVELQGEVLGEDHPNTLTSMSNLASSVGRQGKHAEAEQLYRAVLSLREKILGEDHLSTLASMSDLALLLDRQGKHAEAEQVYRVVLSLQEKVLGKEHPDTLASMSDIAWSLRAQGKHAEAEQLYRAVLSLQEKVLGEEHPDTLLSMTDIASSLSAQGKPAEAEQLYREVLSLQERALGKDHRDTRRTAELLEQLFP